MAYLKHDRYLVKQTLDRDLKTHVVYKRGVMGRALQHVSGEIEDLTEATLVCISLETMLKIAARHGLIGIHPASHGESVVHG